MADPVAAQLPLATESVGRNARPPRLSASLGLVLGYWWVATGLTIAVQQRDATRVLALWITSALAILGVALVVRSRDDTTPQAARQAFFGAALIWWWGAAIFYGGVGLRLPSVAAGAHGSAELAWHAIAATARADLLMVAALALLTVLVWCRPNRVALWTLAAFWGTLQTAKLNVFFGVRNSGAEMLPAHLTGLSVFFGPPRNSALLTPTLLLLTALAIWLVRRTIYARSPFVRHAMGMMSLLLVLALVEHVALGVPMRLPLWDVFAGTAP